MSNDTGTSVVPAGGFTRQGQVDYVAMGNSVFSSTYAVLQRFADAGIQPMTHQAGLINFNAISNGRNGDSTSQRRSEPHMRPYHGFESVLWFGFGHKSYLTLLTVQEIGLNCAALCACLGETYGEARAA